MMLNFLPYIFSVVILINLILSLVVLLQDPKDKINIFFGSISFGVVLWSIAILGFFSSGFKFLSPEIWLTLTHTAAAFIALFFLYFSLNFPSVLIKKKYVLALPMITFLVIVYFLFSTKLIIGDTFLQAYEIKQGYIFYGEYITFLFVLGYLALFLQYRKTKDVLQKTQLKYIFLGSLLSSFFATITDLVLPYIGIFQYTWLGPVFTLILVLSIAFAIIKHHLFNIKVIIAELMTFAIWTAVIAQAVMAETLNGKILGAVTFVFVIFIGLFLIKSVKKEVALREEIEQLAGRLKSVNRIMSHDIKNVLGKDKDMFGMLLDGSFGAVSDQARPFLEQAHDDTKKLIRSVIVILESGQDLVLKPEPFDFKEAVLEVVHDVESEAKTKGLSLTTNISEEGDYMLVGDRVQLVTHVLKNLVENAVNYTLAGGVTVGLSKKGNAILFSVKDTGIGISDEDKPNLFKEGGHGKDSLKVNVHSTGYGLFSVKKIVDAHGGKVWFDTATGKGTTFWVEMPRG